MGREYEWRTHRSDAIHVKDTWKYGWKYIEIIGKSVNNVYLDSSTDSFTIRCKNPDGGDTVIHIGVGIIERILPQFNKLVAERNEKMAYISSLPQCDVCHLHKENGDAYSYKTLKMCQDCASHRGIVYLDNIISKKDAEAANTAASEHSETSQSNDNWTGIE